MMISQDADKKGLSTIAEEVKHLAQKAKDNSLKPEDYEVSTKHMVMNVYEIVIISPYEFLSLFYREALLLYQTWEVLLELSNSVPL